MENEKTWQLLVDAINQNKVVPIIGDEFYYAVVDGEKIPYMDFLLKKLLEKYPLPQRLQDTLAEKDISPDFNMIADSIHVSNIINSQMYGLADSSTNIYYEIEDIVRRYPIICDERIVQFLNHKRFPIVLTTSFLPALEENLSFEEVRSYDKSPRIDISEINNNQLLYYLFGKCSKMNKSFMVTEDDLLDYMHFWHNYETRPKELSKMLSTKFLLVLGCDYPNWLFRFFWHSIKNFNLYTIASEGLKGVVAGNVFDTDNELARFLSRIHTHTYGNCGKVLDIVLSLLPESHKQEELRNNSNIETDNNPDVFISYSHENAEIAQKIANIFEKYGAKVWFDSSALVGSDLYDDIIQRKIEECERFVPIMSEFTENAKRGYFRKEWSLAIEELKFRLGSPYISPIIIDNADINSPRFPKEFRDAHILDYRDSEFENAVKKLIRSFR